MPIYEFKCGACEGKFEELVSAGVESLPCPVCGSTQVYRLISLFSSRGMSAGACSTCTPTPSKCKGCHCAH